MGKKLILIADDDPDVRESLKLMLSATSYALTFAANGKEVLEKMNEKMPDLLVLDLLMPRMDGFEVIKKLKKEPEFSTVPILILTSVKKQASERRYELETGLSLDVDDYIEKPVNPKDFIHRIEKILSRK
ncbi:response regulator [Candidatus Aerophobetes bacterium]|nr:response regulator [Candidatus Aerophobetes bacterium]